MLSEDIKEAVVFFFCGGGNIDEKPLSDDPSDGCIGSLSVESNPCCYKKKQRSELPPRNIQ